jgi:hypothetical protein
MGTSLGIAGVGTLFFSLLGPNAALKLDFLHAAHQTIVVIIGMIVVAGGLAALLPRRAHVPATEWAGETVQPDRIPAPEATLV